MERRVVITGMGIWSCIGKNKEEVKDSLYNGKSGIGLEQARLDYGYQSALTGIVERLRVSWVRFHFSINELDRQYESQHYIPS